MPTTAATFCLTSLCWDFILSRSAIASSVAGDQMFADMPLLRPTPCVTVLVPDLQTIQHNLINNATVSMADLGAGENLQLLEIIDFNVCPTIKHLKYFLQQVSTPKRYSESSSCLVIGINLSALLSGNDRKPGGYLDMAAALTEYCNCQRNEAGHDSTQLIIMETNTETSGSDSDFIAEAHASLLANGSFFAAIDHYIVNQLHDSISSQTLQSEEQITSVSHTAHHTVRLLQSRMSPRSVYTKRQIGEVAEFRISAAKDREGFFAGTLQSLQIT